MSFLKKLSIFLLLISVLFFSHPSSLFAQNGDTETLYLQDGVICKDFDIDYKKISQSTSPAELTPGADQVQGAVTKWVSRHLTGKIELKGQNFPDFSQMEETLSRSLKKLLPQKLKQTLPVDPPTELKNQAKHHVIGYDEDGNETVKEDPTPESKTTLPPWWPNLLKETKITCGLLGSCPAPKSMAIEIKQVNSAAPSPEISCPVGQERKNESMPKIDTVSNDFTLISFLEKIIEDISDLIRNWITTETTETVVLKGKTRENLPGGQTLNSQRPFEVFIPHSLVPTNKNGPLIAKANIIASGSGITGDANDITYQNLAATHREYCLGLCSQIPNGINVSSIDPLCPSCNAVDYPLELENVGGTNNGLPVPPQSCSADKPYEIIPSCTICGNILFCYGNNYRLCETDTRIPTPAMGARNQTWWYSPGDFPDNTIFYNGVSFPVPGGGVLVCDSNVFGCANERCR